MRNAFDLTGQVAIITGSSRGIGRSIAEHGRAGRQGGGLQPQSGRLRGGGGIRAKGQAIVIPCNISRKEEVEALVQAPSRNGAASTRWFQRRGQSVFRSAGRHRRRRGRQNHGGERQEQPVAVNLAIPEMVRRGRQRCHRLIDRRPTRQRHAARLRHRESRRLRATRNLAVEWGPNGVRVNCIAPGLVKTDFARALWEDDKRLKARLEVTPLRRIGEPDDIGGIAAFLASRAAAFMTAKSLSPTAASRSGERSTPEMSMADKVASHYADGGDLAGVIAESLRKAARIGQADHGRPRLGR